jgi:hypothetical protein
MIETNPLRRVMTHRQLSDMVCEQCAFFLPNETREDTEGKVTFGECHRYAPRQVAGAGTGWADWSWPMIKSTDFCGEFEKK